MSKQLPDRAKPKDNGEALSLFEKLLFSAVVTTALITSIYHIIHPPKLAIKAKLDTDDGLKNLHHVNKTEKTK